MASGNMNVQEISSGQLIQELIETSKRQALDRENKELQRRLDQLQAEVDRRMAW